MDLSRRWLCLRISEAIVGDTATHLSADMIWQADLKTHSMTVRS